MKQIVGPRHHQDVSGRRAARQGADRSLDLGVPFAQGRREGPHKAGFPFGMPMSTTSDAVQWVGAMFNSHGRRSWVDAKGEITVRTDAIRTVLGMVSRRPCRFFPAEWSFAWDDRLEQQGADFRAERLDLQRTLGPGRSRKRDAPKVRRAIVDVSPTPIGPKGRHVSGPATAIGGSGTFPANKPAARRGPAALPVDQGRRSRKLLQGGQGFDVPPFDKIELAGLGRGRGRRRAPCTIFPARGRRHRGRGRWPSGAGPDRGSRFYSQGHDVQDDRPNAPQTGQIELTQGDRLRPSRSSKATCAPGTLLKPSPRTRGRGCPRPKSRTGWGAFAGDPSGNSLGHGAGKRRFGALRGTDAQTVSCASDQTRRSPLIGAHRCLDQGPVHDRRVCAWLPPICHRSKTDRQQRPRPPDRRRRGGNPMRALDHRECRRCDRGPARFDPARRRPLALPSAAARPALSWP